jgi:hypothetical protein
MAEDGMPAGDGVAGLAALGWALVAFRGELGVLVPELGSRLPNSVSERSMESPGKDWNWNWGVFGTLWGVRAVAAPVAAARRDISATAFAGKLLR